MRSYTLVESIQKHAIISTESADAKVRIKNKNLKEQKKNPHKITLYHSECVFV